MRQAMALAQRALYVPAPNPRVGCVIARDGKLIAQGATQHVGGAHAEIMALRDLESHGLSAEGATVYISLEPCSHYGRTPPCVDALIKAAPSRVVFAHFDPNPSVAGRGLQALKAAGIDVTVGVCADEALEINPGFVSRMTRGVPYVWLKVAASIDGRTALPNGVSQWITGPQARADGHHWRARSCIVLTGIGTVRTDNPRLDVRHVTTPRQPRRGVIDPGLDIRADAAVLAGGDAVIFTANNDPEKIDRLSAQGARVVLVPDESNPSSAALPAARKRVDLMAMMRWLAANDINEVHVEAGEGMNGALIAAGCVDELVLYMAPMLLGDGKGLARIPAIARLEDAARFEFTDVTRLGSDIRIRARDMARWADLQSKLHLG
ncbi:MAG: bifunctional diaminohydroxyphosphoribosylaminopyrimidine deaminase/5-amino-6-(5-phosphoribosylamino)uracil reductase RibD [Burkholderiaceae bacterium]|nr:bifunctional diaminohydroxyphosphoribosylaminopyrimidine deaminase/5-amino-6-(5-phosphoribosylamino)uracil reductase RibD [Burkholderiaceae bacterium]